MTKNVFKSELKRFFRSKKLWISAVSFILVAFVCIAAATLIEFGTETRDPYKGTFWEEQYREELAGYEARLLNPDIPETERRSTELACARLRFFLDNGTTRSDYAQNDAFNTRDAGRTYMTRYFLLGAVVAVIAAAAGVLFFFGQEYSGRFRMAINQGVKRKDLFFGKTSVPLAFTAAVCLAVMLIGLICAAFSPDSNALVGDYFTYKIHSATIWESFGAYSVAVLTLCAIIYGITLFLSAVTEKPSVTIAVIAAVLIILFIFGRTLKTVGERETVFFPFYGLLNVMYNGGFTSALWVSAAVYWTMAAALYFGAYAIFKRQEL